MGPGSARFRIPGGEDAVFRVLSPCPTHECHSSSENHGNLMRAGLPGQGKRCPAECDDRPQGGAANGPGIRTPGRRPFTIRGMAGGAARLHEKARRTFTRDSRPCRARETCGAPHRMFGVNRYKSDHYPHPVPRRPFSGRGDTTQRRQGRRIPPRPLTGNGLSREQTGGTGSPPWSGLRAPDIMKKFQITGDPGRTRTLNLPIRSHAKMTALSSR